MKDVITYNYKLLHGDCLERMKEIPDGSVDLILTDIPYDGVNRESNGLRKLDKGKADVITFDIHEFLKEVDRICSGTIIIFCAKNQLSDVFTYFENNKSGTVRQLVWQKSNPSPMNGQHIYLSGIENAIWFKKRGSVFNAHCKNTVFKHPTGRSKLHPTEKNHALLIELILDNSNENQVVLDPCMGSSSTGIACLNTNRKFIGIELDDNYFDIGAERMRNH